MIRKNIWILSWITILFLFLISGCKNEPGKTSASSDQINSEISKAERFRLERGINYTRLTVINPWQGAKLSQTYLLVKNGDTLPFEDDSSVMIPVPLRKIICMSTTHAAMISALGEERTISGMSGTRYLFNEKLCNLVGQGLIEEVGYEANLNKELILKIAPDLIMMYGIGSESASYMGKIKELGIKVMFNADYLETDPLGKAEWIKVFGALYCKENLADSIFNSEVDKYNKLKAEINHKKTTRSKVLLGLPFKDTWFISPGNSFISNLITDAGGDYLWKETKSSISMPLGIENVYIRGFAADYWLNIGSVKSKFEISAVDQRLNELPCYRNGNLYNNNKRINLKDGNDYWESGSVYPHLILKDIASILHPDIFIGSELYFYRKIN